MSMEDNKVDKKQTDKNQVPEHLKDMNFVDDLYPKGESPVMGYITDYGKPDIEFINKIEGFNMFFTGSR